MGALLIAPVLLDASGVGAMTLTSSDIADGQAMPRAQIYPRCGGANVAPALAWSGAPKGTKSFALTMIDIDVKPSQWSHWIVVDIPVTVGSLARGAQTLPRGARAVESNFGGTVYNGPCPPSGTHHYRITIWALPVSHVSLTPGAKAGGVAATLTRLALDSAAVTVFVRR